MKVQKMHEKNLIHGNITLCNVFVGQDNEIIIGPPSFKQIHKYANRYSPYQDNTSINIT